MAALSSVAFKTFRCFVSDMRPLDYLHPACRGLCMIALPRRSWYPYRCEYNATSATEIAKSPSASTTATSGY
eukprot:scaffold444373_cov32-Prasinocladus_malaysianus.AAC.1